MAKRKYRYKLVRKIHHACGHYQSHELDYTNPEGHAAWLQRLPCHPCYTEAKRLATDPKEVGRMWTSHKDDKNRAN